MSENNLLIEDGVEVAPPAWLQQVNRYGAVAGLSEDELADPDELERAYYRELWGPVLLLPKPRASLYGPAWDCDVDVDYNAFASVDFDRMRPDFDKPKYKADKLKEQLWPCILLHNASAMP